jgi:tetraspanin-18
MDLGATMVKYCLCLFNFVFVVFGTALLGLGIWLIADLSSLISLLRLASQDQIRVNEYGPATVLEQTGYVFIALGAFIFIISFLGYCGTIKESRFLLGAYAFFLTLIFILEIALVVLFLVYRKETVLETRTILTKSIHKMYSTRDQATPFTVTFDFVMRQGECCGVSNYTDFNQAERFLKNKTASQTIPIACCKLKPEIISFEPIDSNCPNSGSNSNKDTGCLDKLLDTLSTQMNIAIIVGVAVGLLQIIGIVFAVCVYKAAYYDYK